MLCTVHRTSMVLGTDSTDVPCSGAVFTHTLPCVMRRMQQMLPGFGASLIRRTASAAGQQHNVYQRTQAGVSIIIALLIIARCPAVAALCCLAIARVAFTGGLPCTSTVVHSQLLLGEFRHMASSEADRTFLPECCHVQLL